MDVLLLRAYNTNPHLFSAVELCHGKSFWASPNCVISIKEFCCLHRVVGNNGCGGVGVLRMARQHPLLLETWKAQALFGLSYSKYLSRIRDRALKNSVKNIIAETENVITQTTDVRTSRTCIAVRGGIYPWAWKNYKGSLRYVCFVASIALCHSAESPGPVERNNSTIVLNYRRCFVAFLTTAMGYACIELAYT